MGKRIKTVIANLSRQKRSGQVVGRRGTATCALAISFANGAGRSKVEATLPKRASLVLKDRGPIERSRSARRGGGRNEEGEENEEDEDQQLQCCLVQKGSECVEF